MSAAEVLHPGSPAWCRLVTGSKIAPILGISPYTDQYSIWHMMAGNIPAQEQTEDMRRGAFHEGAVLSECKFRHPDWRFTDTSHTQQTSEWLAVTPDEVAVDDADGVLIEVKTTSRWDGWGEAGTDQIPEHYRAQVLVTAHVLQCTKIVLAVMGPFWDYREYQVEPDADLAAAILRTCKDFWDTVHKGTEPPLSHAVSAYETWTQVGTPDGAGEAEISAELAYEYLNAAAAEKSLKAYRADIVNVLNGADAKRAVCQGYPIAQKQKGSGSNASLVISRKAPSPNDITLTEASAA